MSGALEKPLQWNEVKEIVSEYRLEELGRSPEGLKEYHNFKASMQAKGISLTTNIFINTLHWLPVDTDPHLSTEEAVKRINYTDPRLFANPNDTCITLNDFPYWIKEPTIHLLVWVRSPMPPDPNSEIGDIDNQTKKLIEEYVQETFVKGSGIDRDDIIWWKNYTKIQSIKSIPHVHVLIKTEDKRVEEKARALVGTPGATLKYDDIGQNYTSNQVKL